MRGDKPEIQTSVPGIKAKDCMITPACRQLPGGEMRAWDRAWFKLFREYEQLLQNPTNRDVTIYLALTVVRPEPEKGSEAMQNDAPTQLALPTDDSVLDAINSVSRALNLVGRLVLDGLRTDGDRHKDWFLEQIAEAIGQPLPAHQPGVAP